MNKLKTASNLGRPVKYRKIKNTIIADMIRSKLKPGDFYATELSLSERFGVGRNTIRKAVAEMEDADLVVRRKRLGILAGERIAFLNNPGITADNYSSMPSRVVLVLPYWDLTAGGFYCSQVIQELRSQKSEGNRIIDIRPHDDSLDNIGSDIEAVIAVDPRNYITLAKLQIMSKNNIKVIVIEPSLQHFNFAVCIRSTMQRATVSIVKEFIKLGHKNVGIINGSLEHDVYGQLLNGFLQAHHEYRLPIHPNAVIQKDDNLNLKFDVDFKNITAWICSNNSCLDFFARFCNINHLKVPEDVSVIGVDDPGDKDLHSLGTTLSVMRPDYNIVGGMIQQILHDWSGYSLGDIVELPTVTIERNSIAPFNS